jgi:hypothetical protein
MEGRRLKEMLDLEEFLEETILLAAESVSGTKTFLPG